jgi:DNA-binding FadR family transcriptional regulator
VSKAAAAVAVEPVSAPATDSVLETLLGDILGGTYPPGSRLPAERDLARKVGASRPTLREALRRLGEWNLVTARRGSGITIRPEHEWTIEILPAFLKHGVGKRPPAQLARIVADLLTLRRSLNAQLVAATVGRLKPGALAPARAAAARAWDAREQLTEFVVLDIAVFREVLRAAELLPQLWLLNGLIAVYGDLARTFGAAARAPNDYLTAITTMLDRLEAGDAAAAAAGFDAYLARNDKALLSILGVS